MVSQLYYRLVKRWLDSLEFAPKTKSHIKNAFHLLFYYAQWWKLPNGNPIDLVKQSCERLKDPRVLTPQQIKGLPAELRQPYRAMVLVAACTGLRPCEIIGLKWDDLDWGALTLSVQHSVVAGRQGTTKTKASKKSVPLHPDIADKLLEWRRQAHYVSGPDFIFAGDSGRPRWQAMILKNHIQPAADRASIGKVGTHSDTITGLGLNGSMPRWKFRETSCVTQTLRPRRKSTATSR